MIEKVREFESRRDDEANVTVSFEISDGDEENHEELSRDLVNSVENVLSEWYG